VGDDLFSSSFAIVRVEKQDQVVCAMVGGTERRRWDSVFKDAGAILQIIRGECFAMVATARPVELAGRFL